MNRQNYLSTERSGMPGMANPSGFGCSRLIVAHFEEPCPATSTFFARNISIENCFYGVLAMAISPDGRTLASTGESTAGGGKGTVLLWNLQAGTVSSRLEGHSHAVNNLEYSADGGVLASGAYDNSLILWRPDAPEHPKEASGPTERSVNCGSTHASGSWQ